MAVRLLGYGRALPDDPGSHPFRWRIRRSRRTVPAHRISEPAAAAGTADADDPSQLRPASRPCALRGNNDRPCPARLLSAPMPALRPMYDGVPAVANLFGLAQLRPIQAQREDQLPQWAARSASRPGTQHG